MRKLLFNAAVRQWMVCVYFRIVEPTNSLVWLLQLKLDVLVYGKYCCSGSVAQQWRLVLVTGWQLFVLQQGTVDIFSSTHISEWGQSSQYSDRLRSGWIGFGSLQEQRFFSEPDRLRGPPSLLSNVYYGLFLRGWNGWSLCLVLRSEVHGAIPPLTQASLGELLKRIICPWCSSGLWHCVDL
jgi:hypothetical protein